MLLDGLCLLLEDSDAKLRNQTRSLSIRDVKLISERWHGVDESHCIHYCNFSLTGGVPGCHVRPEKQAQR